MCCREYGTQSLKIHWKTCRKKKLLEFSKLLPRGQRGRLPPPVLCQPPDEAQFPFPVFGSEAAFFLRYNAEALRLYYLMTDQWRKMAGTNESNLRKPVSYEEAFKETVARHEERLAAQQQQVRAPMKHLPMTSAKDSGISESDIVTPRRFVDAETQTEDDRRNAEQLADQQAKQQETDAALALMHDELTEAQAQAFAQFAEKEATLEHQAAARAKVADQEIAELKIELELQRARVAEELEAEALHLTEERKRASSAVETQEQIKAATTAAEAVAAAAVDAARAAERSASEAHRAREEALRKELHEESVTASQLVSSASKEAELRIHQELETLGARLRQQADMEAREAVAEATKLQQERMEAAAARERAALEGSLQHQIQLSNAATEMAEARHEQMERQAEQERLKLEQSLRRQFEQEAAANAEEEQLRRVETEARRKRELTDVEESLRSEFEERLRQRALEAQDNKTKFQQAASMEYQDEVASLRREYQQEIASLATNANAKEGRIVSEFEQKFATLKDTLQKTVSDELREARSAATAKAGKAALEERDEMRAEAAQARTLIEQELKEAFQAEQNALHDTMEKAHAEALNSATKRHAEREEAILQQYQAKAATVESESRKRSAAEKEELRTQLRNVLRESQDHEMKAQAALQRELDAEQESVRALQQTVADLRAGKLDAVAETQRAILEQKLAAELEQHQRQAAQAAEDLQQRAKEQSLRAIRDDEAVIADRRRALVDAATAKLQEEEAHYKQVRTTARERFEEEAAVAQRALSQKLQDLEEEGERELQERGEDQRQRFVAQQDKLRKRCVEQSICPSLVGRFLLFSLFFRFFFFLVGTTCTHHCECEKSCMQVCAIADATRARARIACAAVEAGTTRSPRDSERAATRGRRCAKGCHSNGHP